MKRIVTIDDATGNVISEWCGGKEQELLPMPGQTHRILVTGDKTSYIGQQWNGTAFILQPQLPRIDSQLEEQLWRIETKLDELLSKV